MGTPRTIRLGVLTSSRADFGIYLPLLRALQHDVHFEVSIIAFGTHLSPYHGYTLREIEKQGFTAAHTITSMLLHDDAGSIATAFSLTSLKFADFWNERREEFDIVFCLGDRYEMAAAVLAGLPLGIRFAHIHGGETTLGAIDNVYRNAISLASSLHFVAADAFRIRIQELLGTDANCFVTGSLSLDNLDTLQLLDKKSFQEKWSIDVSKPFILVTVHPETVEFEKNEVYAVEILAALKELLQERSIVITMPNADTNGSLFRTAFYALKELYPDKVYLVENFGTVSYFTAMKYADILIGNTSSGIIEAASFKKYVINLGDRQAGRLTSRNVIHVPFNRESIVKEALAIVGKTFEGENVYYKGRAADKIVEVLKDKFNAVV